MSCFLFKDLSLNQVEKAQTYFEEPIAFSKGDEIYKVGYIGILLSGKANISRKNTAGDAIPLRTILPNEIFGSVSIFGDWKDGLSSIIADRDCSVAYICEEDFKRLLFDFPAISLNYISFLSDRLRFLNQKLDIFTANSTESKLYEFLLSLADNEGIVKLPFNMSELAHRLNVGRSSLYRDIDALTQSGLITRNNNVFKINKN